MEACFDEHEKDIPLINEKRVLSFFTVMIEEGFLEVLFFPPKFAKSVSHMIDREINLEDSCGLLWRVTFSSKHDVKVGEFIVFHYVPSDEHFIVQIFGTSDCEKRNYPKAMLMVEITYINIIPFKLSESWRKYLPKREKFGRWIVFLRGRDKRIWPTYYHSRSKFEVLTSGWEKVTAAYGMNAGDKCLFQLVDQQRHLFDVRKI
ncbi:hypothetical protein R3W88_014735 [Solanum pinnatisectum]|uniref:TF-B3 domain-containing protein n=1 Tax=Solanum pinnatisectum TaxID=50273 RepID=A0AAV9KWW5_9SOLN|nr:hypothetical protein R3W88_014735 [Solanum pinnatisectum]